MLLCTMVVFTMCNKPKEKKELKDDPYFRSVEQIIAIEQNLKEKTVGDKSENDMEQPNYVSISDPDTALTYFLYETYQVFKPFEYQEEYQRLDLEYDKQISMIRSIFSGEEDLKQAIDGINQNRKRFINSIRKSVYKDYKSFHGVSGMSFDFLLNRKDSLIKPLLYELVQDEKAPQMEKENAVKILLENYQDSTFKNILE